jgi:hypothetical protein
MKKYNKYFRDVNFFDILNQDEKQSIETLGIQLAHDLFKPNATEIQFSLYAKAFDDILYSANTNSLIKAQYLSNVYFTEIIEKGFQVKNSPKNNPLKIIIDYQVNFFDAKIHISEKSEEKIYACILAEYQKYHSEEVISLKMSYLKNLQKAQWSKDYGVQAALESMLLKTYHKEMSKLEPLKLIANVIVEKEKLEKVIENNKAPNVNKNKIKL